MAIFKGAGVAIVTPFHEDGSVNYEKFEELVEEQIAGGTDAIISCGEDNAYGHPHSETLERLSEHVDAIYRTDELGDIVVSVTPQEYTIITE